MDKRVLIKKPKGIGVPRANGFGVGIVGKQGLLAREN